MKIEMTPETLCDVWMDAMKKAKEVKAAGAELPGTFQFADSLGYPRDDWRHIAAHRAAYIEWYS